mmetsp:Transcript_24911/g.77626  ORF Transcript_24911/g.77626 Transcript_24911/m.77626 type:complete len:204 (-) Transcript_24911:240-851(-)
MQPGPLARQWRSWPTCQGFPSLRRPRSQQPGSRSRTFWVSPHRRRSQLPVCRTRHHRLRAKRRTSTRLFSCSPSGWPTGLTSASPRRKAAGTATCVSSACYLAVRLMPGTGSAAPVAGRSGSSGQATESLESTMSLGTRRPCWSSAPAGACCASRSSARGARRPRRLPWPCLCPGRRNSGWTLRSSCPQASLRPWRCIVVWLP